MEPVTPDEFYANSALRRRLFEAAHRERARTVRAALDWLASRIAARLAPGPRSARWLARLG